MSVVKTESLRPYLKHLVPDAKYVGGTSNDHLSFIVLVSSYGTKRAFGSFRFQGTGIAAVSVPAIATSLLENSKPQLFIRCNEKHCSCLGHFVAFNLYMVDDAYNTKYFVK